MMSNSEFLRTNQPLTSDPDGDLVDKLFVGFAEFLVFENALKANLFDYIEQESGPVSVATLSTRHGYHSDVLERMLDNLSCMKLVQKHSGDGKWTYTNTRAASVYLTKASKFYKGNAFQIDRMLMERVASGMVEVLKTGPKCNVMEFMKSGTVRNANDNEKNSNMTNGNMTNSHSEENKNINKQTNKMDETNANKLQNRQQTATTPDLKSDSEISQSRPPAQVTLQSMDAMLYSSRHAIPTVFDLSGSRVAVDLGGSTGFLARLLLDNYPKLTATVFEQPHVVSIAQTMQDKTGDNGRLSFVGGDFFIDDLPPADLYILSRVIHGWNEKTIISLLDKIYKSLPPGGKLLIFEKFLNERKDGPNFILNVHLNIACFSEGRERTVDEYTTLVERLGFTNTRGQVINGVNLVDALLTCKPF